MRWPYYSDAIKPVVIALLFPLCLREQRSQLLYVTPQLKYKFLEEVTADKSYKGCFPTSVNTEILGAFLISDYPRSVMRYFIVISAARYTVQQPTISRI